MLLIFQAMDAAGKDSAIKHVMSGVDPKGCQVYSFKAPSSEELDHDFLWRTSKCAAGARADRHLQPLVLRGDADRPGAPDHPQLPEAAGRGSSPSGSGTSASRTSTRSSATWRATDSSSGSSSSTSRGRSSGGGSWRGSIGRKRTGSSRLGIWPNAAAGGPTWRPTRTRSAQTATPHAPWVVIPGGRQEVRADGHRRGGDRRAEQPAL